MFPHRLLVPVGLVSLSLSTTAQSPQLLHEVGTMPNGLAASAGDVDADGVEDVAYLYSVYDPVAMATTSFVEVHSGATGALLWQADSGATDDGFGASMTHLGDVNGDGRSDLLVGAPWTPDPLGGESYGRAFVFSGLDGSVIRVHDGYPGYNLGRAADGGGDANGDGVPDYIVGAPLADSLIFGGHVGRAYVFSGLDGSLLQVREGITAGAGLGHSVAGLGDVEGDGSPDFLAGSPTWATATGRALVFSGATALTLHYPEGEAEWEYHGYVVDGIGDVDDDGTADFVLGTPYATDPSLILGGRTTVYSGSTGLELYEVFGSEDNDWFGAITRLTVRSIEDVDGDGVDELALGYPYRDPGGVAEAGEVDIHSGTDGSHLLTIEGSTASENLGYTIDALNDINGNWTPDVILASLLTANVYDLGFGLVGDASEISLSSGGAHALSLHAGAALAGELYLILGSSSGTTPGIPTGGPILPLNVDVYFNLTLNQPNPAFLPGSFGTLDASGSATAAFTLPAGFNPSLEGLTLHHAAVVFDATGSALYASNPMPLDLVQ